MKKYVKKLMSGVVAFALAFSMLAIPVLADGVCQYETENSPCSVTWGHNSSEHYCYCMRHQHPDGSTVITFGPEAHDFSKGESCSVCGYNPNTSSKPEKPDMPELGESAYMSMEMTMECLSRYQEMTGGESPLIFERSADGSTLTITFQDLANALIDELHAANGIEPYFKNFQIKLALTNGNNYEYTGSAIEPATVNKELLEHYPLWGLALELENITYKNNINPGTATAAIIVRDYFDGTEVELTKNFTILKDGEVPPADPAPNPDPAPTGDFTDVTSNDWFKDYVGYVNEKGLMRGLNETTFGPAQLLSRAQFAVILHRMEGEPEVAYEAIFPDVPATGVFFTEAAMWANANKIITGYDNGNFGPADNITREQMAVMMYRYAKAEGFDTSKAADLTTFPDASSVSAFAKEAIAWAIGEGLITGDQGNINPQGNASRAVCATIITRFDQNVAE